MSLREQVKRFERQAKLTDDKEKCDLLIKTRAGQFRVSGPLFDKKSDQLGLFDDSAPPQVPDRPVEG